MSANISHGRGGAANIRPDDTPYTDGEITREGPVGSHGDGPYSAGRGGAGNIDSDDRHIGRPAGDADIIPETATRERKDENFHFGRGGAGNELYHQKAKKETTVEQHGFEKKVPHESLKDKVKEIFHKEK